MAGERRGRRYPGDVRADLVVLALLLAYGTFIRTPLYGSFERGAFVSLALEPLAAAIVVLLRKLFETLRFDRALTAPAVGIVVLACMAGALVQSAFARFALGALGLAVEQWTVGESWALPFAYYTTVMLSWSLAHLWAAAQREAAEARRRAAVAENEALLRELQHLRQQLDPHFLFNALNGISAEISAHPDRAADMVLELSDFLRYSLAHRELRAAPLSAEVEAVRAYLAVQESRYGDALTTRIAIDEAALARETPGFLLQPLVENAVKHGLRSGPRPLVVVIEASLRGDDLEMRVVHGGRLDPDWRERGMPGVGLPVLQRRLELHYPGHHAFALAQEQGMVVATLRLTGAPCLV
jgi:two-component system LytT family sensor kinase